MILMARKGRRKGRGRSSGFTIDGTEFKMAGILFRQYNGPSAVKKATNRDLGGALDEWGKGDLVDVGINSLTAGAVAGIRRKAGFYLQPIKSRFLKFRM